MKDYKIRLVLIMIIIMKVKVKVKRNDELASVDVLCLIHYFTNVVESWYFLSTQPSEYSAFLIGFIENIFFLEESSLDSRTDCNNITTNYAAGEELIRLRRNGRIQSSII